MTVTERFILPSQLFCVLPDMTCLTERQQQMNALLDAYVVHLIAQFEADMCFFLLLFGLLVLGKENPGLKKRHRGRKVGIRHN